MRIAGIDPKTLPKEEVLVLPRGNDQMIVFKATGVDNMDEFNKLCPEPQAPGKFTKNGWELDVQNKSYQESVAEWSKRRFAYMVIRSLEASQIEWESVRLDTPGTWAYWEKDLREGAALSQVECNRVMGLVLEANCLDEAKLKRARDFFLQAPLVSVKSTSLTTETEITQSGEPAAE